MKRITLTQLIVIEELLSNPDNDFFAYGLKKKTGVPTGTINDMLRRFKASGWLTSRWEEIDPSIEFRPRRRLYQLTDKGKNEAREIFDKYNYRLERK